MKLSDEKLIEFLWKSSLKSFPAMLAALRYLDGKWVQEEAKYEIFDEATGDKSLMRFKSGCRRSAGFPPTHSSFCSSCAGFRFDQTPGGNRRTAWWAS